MTGGNQMTGLQYHVDGELVPASEASISVDDRGFRYGDAAFETMRAYGGSIFEWEAHADRFDRTCSTLRLEHGLSRADLRTRIDETLGANDLEEAYVRLSITRGVQPGTLAPKRAVDPTVVVIAKPLPRGGIRGRPVWDAPAWLAPVETRKPANDALPAAAKTHNYLNGILARLELRERERRVEGGRDRHGVESETGHGEPETGHGEPETGHGEPETGHGEQGIDEALLCGPSGFVAEGTTSNLFFVEGGTLHTPSVETETPVLAGVTRRVVLELAGKTGIPIEEGRYEPTRLREADELFLTNTTWELRPVTRFDDDPYPVGPVTERLAGAFDALIERRSY